MMQNLIEKYLIPSIDKLKHFFLWSIFLAILLSLKVDNILAYKICIGSAVLWELIQKLKKGTNSFKEMCLDVFFGGVLPCILNFIA